MRRFCLLGGFLLLASILFSQKVHIGVFGGMSAYQGDLTDKIFADIMKAKRQAVQFSQAISQISNGQNRRDFLQNRGKRGNRVKNISQEGHQWSGRAECEL